MPDEGCPRKQVVVPAERREIVQHLVTTHDLLIQRASRRGTGTRHVLSAGGRVGPAGCTGDCRTDGDDGPSVLELLEMLRPVAIR